MKFCGVDVNIPEVLIDAASSGNLVIFAGAGVSMQPPVNLPGFDALVDSLRFKVDPAGRLRNRATAEVRQGEGNSGEKSSYTESPEQYLGYLEDNYPYSMRHECSRLLSFEDRAPAITTKLHRGLLRLFPGKSEIRLITTNFDCCFENAIESAGETEVKVYAAPALPLGDCVDGIVHLHGVVDDPDNMVLTSRDYGRAYVTKGWASRFLVDLFSTYYVLFVGYSCGDSLVDYLTRSISQEISGRAFVLCKSDDPIESWRMRGIEPILFNEFEDLPIVFEEWSDFLGKNLSDHVQQLREIGMSEQLEDDQADALCYLLTKYDVDDRAVLAREFCAHSDSFHHLKVLWERGAADFFVNPQPREADVVLLRWAVSTFAVSCYQKLQELCFPKRGELSVAFYQELLICLQIAGTPPAVAGSWMAWIELMPRGYIAACDFALIRFLAACDNPEIIFALLRTILKIDLFSETGIYQGFKHEPALTVRDGYIFECLLNCVKKHASIIGERVFDYCFRQIEFAYDIQTGYWTRADAFDSISYSRSAVEPHEQDRYSGESVGVLLDVARESIQHAFAHRAVERCLGSRCTLLIRLGIWLLYKYGCTADALDLIIDRGFLNNVFLHHEVFLLARDAYSLASQSEKASFCESLKSMYPFNDDNEYELYNLCNWLLETEADAHLEAIRSEILVRHPNYVPREHPDLTHYVSSGIVDNSATCHIPKEQFTIETMLERLSQPQLLGDFVTPNEIVSYPARDYPDKAVKLLARLFESPESKPNNDLSNLLLTSIEWGIPKIEKDDIVDLFRKALEREATCVCAVEALSRAKTDSGFSTKIDPTDLIDILSSADVRIDLFFNSEFRFISNRDTDWFTVGINHPAGKLLLLLTNAISEMQEERDDCAQVGLKLVHDILRCCKTESSVARSLCACYFHRLDLWAEMDNENARDASTALSGRTWAEVPAWQGISYLPRLTQKVWLIIRSHWKAFFSENLDIGDGCFGSLVRICAAAAVRWEGGQEDRINMLKACMSGSPSSLKSTSLEIDAQLDSMTEDERREVWNGMLLDALTFAAGAKEWTSEVLAECYCRWIRKFPDLRAEIIPVMTRDCGKVNKRSLYLHEGLLSNISDDQSISVSLRVDCIAYLLNHTKYLIDTNDAQNAVGKLSSLSLDRKTRSELSDAAVRHGLSLEDTRAEGEGCC